MKIAWTARAVRDLEAVRDYIAQDSPRAAQGVAAAILASVERLVDFPASGRPGRLPHTRELVVPGTPFVIAYRVEAGAVEILAVIHGARRWPEA